MKNQKVDVICQHCKDGRIIPIKIRLVDEDGLEQQFIIKSYHEVAAITDGYTMPNDVKIAPNCMWKKYRCCVIVFGREQWFFLTFSKTDLTWDISLA